MSQSEVAREGGPSRPTISRIERGEPVESLDSQLQRLSLVLRTPLDYFIKGEIQTPLAKERETQYKAETLLDAELLAAILAAIQEGLEARKVKLPPKVFGTLVATIYEAALQEAALREDLSSRIQPFIRLALAGAG